jgi:GTP-binding protein HflX
VSLSDTVGFIRDLPHTLVDAFEATLQEAAQADLLLHVVDASHPDWTEQLAQVQSVLADIGAADIPQWLIFNKVDLLPADLRPLQAQDVYEWDGRMLPRVFLSAVSDEGMTGLRQRLAEFALSRQPEPGEDTPAEDAVSPHDPAG